jgi:arylsulfatase A-like enzyme
MLGLAHRGFSLTEPAHHMGRVLSSEGYESVLCGIEHLAPPDQPGGNGANYDRVLDAPSAHGSDVADAVCAFLREERPQPFFLSVGTQETHTPYPDPEPSRVAENPAYCTPPRPFPDTPALRAMTAGYKRSAHRMDACFGAILEALAETGLDRSTYVFAFTDHGLQWPLHIANVGEHGNAVFLVARGPRHFQGGRAVDAMVSLMDLAPTVYGLAGLDAPPWLQGQSLLPLVDGETDRVHEKLFFEQTYHAAYEPMRAVRTERHVYIKRFDERDALVLPNTDDTPAKDDLLAAGWQQQPRHQEMLYDLYFDPDQQNNLIGAAGVADVVAGLRGELARWMAETEDPLLVGPVALPKGGYATSPDAFSPSGKPRIYAD